MDAPTSKLLPVPFSPAPEATLEARNIKRKAGSMSISKCFVSRPREAVDLTSDENVGVSKNKNISLLAIRIDGNWWQLRES